MRREKCRYCEVHTQQNQGKKVYWCVAGDMPCKTAQKEVERCEVRAEKQLVAEGYWSD